MDEREALQWKASQVHVEQMGDLVLIPLSDQQSGQSQSVFMVHECALSEECCYALYTCIDVCCICSLFLKSVTGAAATQEPPSCKLITALACIVHCSTCKVVCISCCIERLA